MLLGDGWLERDGHLEVHDPEDGSLVGRVAAASPADAELAIDSARSAARLSRAERGAVLERAAHAVEGRAAEFAETIAREGIKTIREARAEVARCARTL